jgi:hypothetical protein
MFTTKERQTIFDLSDNFTPQQIADRIGGSRDSVYAYLRSIKIEPLTQADIVKNKLYKEAHLYSREEMQGRVDVGKATFDKYVMECGVKFKEKEEAVNETKPKKSFNDLRKLQELMEDVRDYCTPNIHVHVKDGYTQSGSPFGLADELKGIQLKTV